ncbi:MAG: Rpn family recombination-promoting nuclease/putative transposase, partial [Lachnospiraceae bacterium]|nr:Rpn family recombination-promoting nuclease/putative transposase [Lachnospiraceae bacterium]
MGKKDIKLKTYLQDAIRYADLWNGGVFKGKQVVRAEELQEITPVRSWSEGDASLERTSDLVMKQNYDGQRFAILALENQEKIDYAMPVRVMVQEALEYEKQVKAFRQKNERAYRADCGANAKKGSDAVYKDDGEYLYKVKKDDYLSPVVTLVVYLGEDEWKGAKSLHEMVDFGSTQAGAELRKLIPEYPLHFLDLSRFAHFEYFKTELRPLLELFQKRNSKEEFAEYIRKNTESSNMDEESWNLLSNLIDSKNIKKLIQKKEQMKEEEGSMCNALDELIADGVAMGKAEFIIDLLEEYGEVPADLREMILGQTDVSVLKGWFKIAVHAGSVGEFAER